MNKYGHGLTVNWPAGIAENGSNAVLGAVKGSVGAIGYLELAYAKAAGMPVTAIQNRAGEFVEPSPASASLAVNAAIDILAKDLRTPIVDPPATAKGAYPVTGLSFILIPKDSNGLNGELRHAGALVGIDEMDYFVCGRLFSPKPATSERGV
jgi:phosphate transport system substrate-binding protein